MKPKRLFLLRHAKSSWADGFTEDFDRPLSKRGRKAASSLCKWLKLHDLEPEFVLCSAALRTRQTLDLIQEGFKSPPKISIERRLYLAEADLLMARLAELEGPDHVLLIGHNPGLEDLALRLIPKTETATRERIEAKFPTCAFVALTFNSESWRRIGPANATLDAYRIPADEED